MPDSPGIAVGDPFLFEGIGCTVTEVGGKTGKLVTVAPADPKAAGFDARSFALAEVRFHPTLKVWAHPARAFPKKPRPGAFVAGPITGEG